MQIEKPPKPKLARVYVTIQDPDSRTSKTKTIYGATRDQVMDALIRAIQETPRKRTAKNAAA
jgi:hypothetical protein